MAFKFQLWALAALVAATSVAVNVVVAEDPADESKDTSFDATLTAARKTSLNVEAPGYGGELRVKRLVAPGTAVKEGEVVAVIEAPDLAEQQSEHQMSAAVATASLEWWEHAHTNEARNLAVRLERAKLEFEGAKFAQEWFKTVGKADRLKNAELNVQYNKDSIEDQEEELRQLEALYKGNDLAKESQDIVLRRSKRRLEQSRIRMKMVQNDYERAVKFDIPREEANLALNLDSEKLEFDALKVRAESGLLETTGGWLRAQADVESTKRRGKRLFDVKPSWEIKAPHAGVVIHAGEQGVDGMTEVFSAGQKIGHGTALAVVLDTSSLRCTVWLTAEQGNVVHSQKNLFKVHAGGQGLVRDARVVAVGSVFKDGKLAASLEVDNADSRLLHGQPAVVKLAASRGR